MNTNKNDTAIGVIGRQLSHILGPIYGLYILPRLELRVHLPSLYCVECRLWLNVGKPRYVILSIIKALLMLRCFFLISLRKVVIKVATRAF